MLKIRAKKNNKTASVVLSRKELRVVSDILRVIGPLSQVDKVRVVKAVMCLYGLLWDGEK